MVSSEIDAGLFAMDRPKTTGAPADVAEGPAVYRPAA
jgi:hypothetical protein